MKNFKHFPKAPLLILKLSKKIEDDKELKELLADALLDFPTPTFSYHWELIALVEPEDGDEEDVFGTIVFHNRHLNVSITKRKNEKSRLEKINISECSDIYKINPTNGVGMNHLTEFGFVPVPKIVQDN